MDKTQARTSRRQVLAAGAVTGALATVAPHIGRSAASAQSPVTLVYKTHENPPATALNKVLIEEFQAQHPGITIEYEAIPYENYEQGLFTAFAGGEGWDVFWAGDWLMPQFLENGIVAPVDPSAYGVASADEFVALFDEGALDPFMQDGQAYTGGISEYNTFSLLYNPDHFAEAGIEPPSATEPMTWEQLAQHAQKLAKTDADGKKTRAGIAWFFPANVWAPLILEPMVHQLGGELVDPTSGDVRFDSPEAVKAMTFVGELATTYQAIDPALFVGIGEDFAEGRTSMLIAGAWALGAIRSAKADQKIAVAPLPVFEGGQRSTTLYSWAWFVGSQASAEKQAAAWTFLNFLTSQGKRWWDEAAYIQPRNTGQEGVEDLAGYRAEQEPLLPVFYDDFAYGRYMFRSTRFYDIATALMQVQSLVLEGEDAEQALGDAQDELDV